MTDNTVPFTEILSDLRRLSETGATGAMFIATSDNRSAQLALDKGRIVYLYHAGRVGLRALEDMARIQAGRYRFQPGNSSLPRLDLPDTASILAALAGGPMLGASAGSKADPLTPTQKSVLESCLAEFVGPIAGILCDDHLPSAVDLDSAIKALERELPSEVQVQQFRNMVRSKLR